MNKIAKWLKFSVLTLISVFLLLIIALSIVAATIDANDFKPQIQALVEKKLGRQLHISGAIELSVFPWVGFSTTKLGLSNIEGFSDKPFAKVEIASIKVKMLPLLLNKIEVKQIRLTGLVLNLTKNKQGLNNWDDLFNTTKNESGPGFLIDSLAIEGVSIQQAKITWDDQQQNTYTEINDFSLKTGKILFNHSIPIDSSLTLVNKEPAIRQFFQLSSSLTINKSLDTFNLTSISIDSVTHSKDLAVTPLRLKVLANVTLNLSLQTLDISTLDINLKNLLLSAKINIIDIMTKPLLKGVIKIPVFNLAQLLKSISIDLPEMHNPTALSKLSATFKIQATPEAAEIENITIKLDNSTVKGSACVKNFNDPISYINLSLDTINTDHYLPKKKENAIPSKTLANQPESTVTKSTIFLPAETLRKLNINGQLTIESLNTNELNIQGLYLKLNSKKGIEQCIVNTKSSQINAIKPK